MADPSTAARFPIPTTLNLVIIGTQLVCIAGIFYGASIATTWQELVLLAVVFGVVGNSIYSIIHEAEHRILHPVRKVNDVLGTAMALLFPAPFHLIRQGHIGHHRRNRSDDEAFDFYFIGERPLLKWLQLYGTLTGLFWITVVLSNIIVLVCPYVLQRRYFAFDRPSAALMESLNPAYWRLIKLEAVLVITLHTLVVWGMGIPFLNYVAVYFGFGFTWSAMQYVHHFGTERHVLRGTRNLWICAPIDWIWLHHNWHLLHHQHPTLPWIYLPQVAQKENPGREFLLWHYLQMWRGPRYTDEHVENRYAGRIIR